MTMCIKYQLSSRNSGGGHSLRSTDMFKDTFAHHAIEIVAPPISYFSSMIAQPPAPQFKAIVVRLSPMLILSVQWCDAKHDI